MNATIDETIDRVEQLYRALTGNRPPTGRHTVIPPEADPVGHVQEQLGRMVSLVERFVPGTAPQWMPHATVWIHESDLMVAVDVPGVLATDVEVRIEQAAITVRGLRRPPWAQPPKTVAHCDALLGTFMRSFPLAVRVAPEHVSARLDDGVLTVRLHANARAEPSQIPICS
jgi:HSP20 family protein